MRTCITLSILLLLADSPTINGTEEIGFLDVTAAVVEERRRQPLGGVGQAVGGGVGDGVKTSGQPPTGIRLLSVDHVGNAEVIYEVEISNLSDTPVIIPWTASPRAVEPNDPTISYVYMFARLRLHVVAPGIDEYSLAPTLLFGSSETGTLRQLLPGQLVRIRTSAKLPQLEQRAGVIFRASWSLHEAMFSPNGPERRRIIAPPRSSNTLAADQQAR